MSIPRVTTLLVALFVASSVRAAAVAVSPVAVYMDDRGRQGAITLFNPGERPEEVRIEFGFGYPVSDAEGNVTVPVAAEAPAHEPSAVPWLQAFPRRLRLEPGQRQVVRVIARPPADLPDGEFWARALVRSRGGIPPIEQQQGDVAVQLDVETVMVVAVNYRNGDVRTGVRVATAEAGPAGEDMAEIRVDLTRTGNAAFLGRIAVELLDAEGRIVAEADEIVAVYRELHKRIRLPLDPEARPVGARIRLDTERDDLPPGGPLPVTPVVVELPYR